MRTLADWLNENEFTLALSSSFFGFYAHCGIAAAIYEAGIRPRKLSGASAGALVAGALASGLSPLEMKKILFQLRREDFWDPKIGPGFLAGKKMLKLFQNHFVSHFEHAQIPLEVAVFDLFSLRTKFLKEGSLPHAIAASCAVPLMFHPVRIGRKVYFDGGVLLKSGVPMDNEQEHLLCVYLQSEGISSVYEWNLSLKKMAPKHRMLSFRGLPKVDYNSLNNGPTAFQQAYERTKEALGKSFQDGIVHS